MRNPISRLLVRYADAARAARRETHPSDGDAGGTALRFAARLSPDDPAVRRALAERAEASGDAAEAEAVLRAGLEHDAGDLELRLALARLLHRRGRAEEARRTLEPSAESAAAEPAARAEYAAVLSTLGRHGDALAHAKAALAARAADADLRGFVAFLLHRTGALEESAQEFDQALAGGAGERVFAWKARLAIETGRRADAADALRKGLERFPRSTRLLGDYARFLAEQGAGKEAQDLLHQALRIDPSDPLNLTSLGSLLSRGGSDEGERYYRYALAIDPSHERALTGLLLLLDRAGRSGEAVPALRAAVAHAGASAAVLCTCAARLAEAGADDEANRAWTLAIDRAPDHPVVALSYGDRQLDLGNNAEADRWYRRAAASPAADAQVLARVGGAKLQMGRAAEAEELAQRALALDPKNGAALGVRAGVLTARGDFLGALELRRRSLQDTPDDAASHLDTADLLARLERYEDAKLEIDLARSLAPSGALLADYGASLLSQGRSAFGIAALADAVAAGAATPRLRFVFAHLLAAAGRADDARSHLAVALEDADRKQLDTRALAEARSRVVAPIDPDFARALGGA